MIQKEFLCTLENYRTSHLWELQEKCSFCAHVRWLGPKAWPCARYMVEVDVVVPDAG